MQRGSMFKRYARRFFHDFVFRTRIILPLSAAASVLLCCYYLMFAVLHPQMRWQTALATWYLLLFLAKLYLLRAFYGGESSPRTVGIVTAGALLLLGLEALAFVNVFYFCDVRLTLQDSSVVLNGTVFLSTAFSFLGRRFFKCEGRMGAYYRCRKYLARAESFFALVLLFLKLVELFDWSHDGGLLLAQYLGGLLAGAYSLTLALRLLIAGKRQCAKKTAIPANLPTSEAENSDNERQPQAPPPEQDK